jgi:hypothetical protein
LRLVILLALLATATIATAQSLWNGTEYGMSVDQVKAAIPDATVPTEPGRLADGAEALLAVEDVEIVGKKFTASIFFITGKLTQVTLSLKGRHTFQSAMSVLKSLAEPLRLKYGQEISRDVTSEERSNALNRASVTWMAGRTNINVFVLSFGKDDALLNINYQTRIARDSDKL